MTREELLEKVTDLLEDMAETDLCYIYNQYCEDNHYYEERIYSMCELNELLCCSSAADILNSVDATFSTNDDWFRDTIYGLHSFDYLSDEIEISEIVEYIVDGMTPDMRNALSWADTNGNEIIELVDAYDEECEKEEE